MFVELADTLVDHFHILECLNMLVERCVEMLDVSVAGVVLTDQKGRLSLAAASSECARPHRIVRCAKERTVPGLRPDRTARVQQRSDAPVTPSTVAITMPAILVEGGDYAALGLGGCPLVSLNRCQQASPPHLTKHY